MHISGLLCFLTISIFALDVNSFRFQVVKVTELSRHMKRVLNSKTNNAEDLESLKLDESKLSQEEQTRIKFINKLSLEADEIIKNAGFSDRLDDDEVMRALEDTKWSGQSDVEVANKSTKTYDDLNQRWGLAFGDAVALLAFAATGRSNHGEGVDVFGVIFTASPFIASWLLVSPILGAYTREATSSKTAIPLGILPAWSISIPLALAIRGVAKGAIPPTPFIIVSLVSTMVFISIWRYIYLSLVGTTADGEDKQAGAFEVFKMVGTLIKRW